MKKLSLAGICILLATLSTTAFGADLDQYFTDKTSPTYITKVKLDIINHSYALDDVNRALAWVENMPSEKKSLKKQKKDLEKQIAQGRRELKSLGQNPEVALPTVYGDSIGRAGMSIAE